MASLIGISRRRTLGLALGLVMGVDGSAWPAAAQPPDEEPCPPDVGQHNMLVFGKQRMLLSHLPMFVGLCPDRAHFATEHRFQLILEATLEDQRTHRDVTEIYRQERDQNPQTRMYSLAPQHSFALSEIFGAPGRAGGIRKSFPATVFRGHLERGGVIISGLRNATVRITRVVHVHEFLPGDRSPENAEYFLFGTPSELFLAHRIVAPGDFDQVLSVRIADQQVSDTELGQDLRVVVPGQPNSSSARLREGQNAPVQLLRKDTPALNISMQVSHEIYFEESELAMPPTDNTREELDAGFGPHQPF
jgi:hypothetical protein